MTKSGTWFIIFTISGHLEDRQQVGGYCFQGIFSIQFLRPRPIFNLNEPVIFYWYHESSHCCFYSATFLTAMSNWGSYIYWGCTACNYISIVEYLGFRTASNYASYVYKHQYGAVTRPVSIPVLLGFSSSCETIGILKIVI